MNRTASTNQSLKPVSSTIGITSELTSGGNTSLKSDLYANCISQLQSTHNAMREAQNITSFTGSLSPSPAVAATTTTTSITTIAPILVRTNKLNQSQSSVHSSTNGIIQHHHHKPTQMTTFGSPLSSSTAGVIGGGSGGGGDIKMTPTNPIPCKRRTTLTQQQQPHTTGIPQSSSSMTVSEAAGGGELVKRRGVAFHLDNNGGGEHEYTDIDTTTSQPVQQQQQQQPPPVSHRKSSNDDDMQRLVAYINQFEQDSNSNIRSAAAEKCEPHVITLSGDRNDLEVTAQVDVVDSGGGVTSAPLQQSPSDDLSTNPVVATKLRLSSSSLSSSASENGDDDDEEDSHNDENNEYEELRGEGNEQPQPVGRRINDDSSKQIVDRRTYIVNKLYDNLEGSGESSSHPLPTTTATTVFPMDENVDDDNQYEKVIIDKRKKSLIDEATAAEYDNDLLVTSEPIDVVGGEKNVIMVVNRSATSTLKMNNDDEHIYMNVGPNTSTMISTSKSSGQQQQLPSPQIRESLGFDVTEIVQRGPTSTTMIRNENIYENGGGGHSSVVATTGSCGVEEKFDSDLVELNKQIKNLLNSTTVNEQKSGQKSPPPTVAPPPPTVTTSLSFRAPNSISSDDLKRYTVEAKNQRENVSYL